MAWPLGTDVESTVVEAKKEGTVVLYGSIPFDYMAKFNNAFEKRFPFLKVKVFCGNNERVRDRVLTEGRLGRYSVDVISLDAINGWLLKEKGYLQPYKSVDDRTVRKLEKEGLV